MNSLSWLIYLCSVLPSLSFLFVGVGFAGLVAYFVGVGIWSGETGTNHFKSTKLLGIIPAVLLLIATLIPSERALYMIAASEMGETVVTSEAGQEVFNELKDTVMYQLEKLQGEGEPK